MTQFDVTDNDQANTLLAHVFAHELIMYLLTTNAPLDLNEIEILVNASGFTIFSLYRGDN